MRVHMSSAQIVLGGHDTTTGPLGAEEDEITRFRGIWETAARSAAFGGEIQKTQKMLIV